MFYKPSNKWLKLGKRLLLKRLRTALPIMALLRKRVKMRMISPIRNLMHFSNNQQIRIVKQRLRNILILMSEHAVQRLQSTQMQQIGDSVQKCVTEYLRKKSGKDNIEVVSFDDDEGDVDVGNAMVEAEVMRSPHAKH